VSSFDTWAQEVLHLLRASDRVRVTPLPGETAAELLTRCRGDEPVESWGQGEDAVTYAAFVCEANEQDGDTGYLEDTEL
jgi:hypothetical protein